MWAMMQKFRICAGAVKVWSAKLLMGSPGEADYGCYQGIHAGAGRHNRGQATSHMLGTMAPPWKTFQRFAENLVFNEAPKFVRQLQNSQTLQRGIQQGIKIGLDAIAGTADDRAPAITVGRPVSRNFVPTAQRARKLVYAPDLDGRADPGEIVWTWVVYEDDPDRGKDRPVLVVGRDRSTLLGLMLSSQEHHHDDANWVAIGSGTWDYESRQSWVRLDRVLDVPEEGIRREGAILEREKFDMVATRLRADFSWS